MADIAVPYWMLVLTAFVLFCTAGAFFWAVHKYVQTHALLARSDERISDLLKPKHFMWVGQHQAGDQFFRINSIPASRFHYITGRTHALRGYKEDRVVFLFGYGWRELEEVLAVIDMSFPNAERYYIP